MVFVYGHMGTAFDLCAGCSLFYTFFTPQIIYDKYLYKRTSQGLFTTSYTIWRERLRGSEGGREGGRGGR